MEAFAAAFGDGCGGPTKLKQRSRDGETHAEKAKILPFQFFDHTADIAVTLTAPTREGLFTAACEAFCQAVTEPERVTAVEPRSVQIRAGDIETLLIDWLGELIYWFDADRWLARVARVTLTSNREQLRLVGTVFGEPFNSLRHPIKVLIKAATYHGLSVKQTSRGWTATVVFDV